jgi:Mu-like prophage I protein
MEYRTIEGVELVTVGMEWPASTGPVTFTFEHLADAMAAANDDPHIISPRGKLGHESEVNGELNVIDPFAALGDAAPAFGKYVNLRLDNDGAVLLGDWIEIPAWLADAAPSAFPNRSIEATFDVTTEGGKHYTMVITGVASLGAYLPAVSDLEDLEQFMVSGPDLDAVAATQSPEEGRMPESTAASIDVGTIRQRFNWEWTTDNDTEHDTYWWWARSVRVDPLEIIADDDEGGLYLIPISTDGKDEITFGEPVPVREEFVPVAASAEGVAATVRQRVDQQVLATELERPEKPAPKTAASQPDPQEDEMSIDLDKLRGRLGLPDDATEEQINEALAKEPETPAEPTEPVTPSDEIPAEPETTPAEPEPIAASAELPDGMVAVPAGKWAEVQAGAKAGGELASTTEIKRRDDTIAAAVKAGKVPPSEKEALCNMHESPATRAAFYTLLTADVKDGGLAKGLVPVSELGEAGSDEVSASAGLPGNWFPELATTGASGAKED